MKHQRWLIAVTVVWAGFVAMPWVGTVGPQAASAARGAMILVTGLAGGLMVVASRRPDFAPRLRLALRLLGSGLLLVALCSGWRLLRLFAPGLPDCALATVAATVLVWALGFVALLLIPLAPLARGDWWRVVIDTTIAVVGMALMLVVAATLPDMHAAPSGARLQIATNGAMASLNLVALNLILVRGPVRSIRRAVWCLAATVVIEVVFLVAQQYALGRGSSDARLVTSLFFLDHIGYLYAGFFFLADPQAATDEAAPPIGMRIFNPLPVLAVCGVGALLLLSASHRPDPVVLPLAAGIVFMSLLLVARAVGATWENLRLLGEEADEDRRRQAEKTEAMGRLSAGIAHVINNLMTVVLGHAQLGLERVDRDDPVRANLASIGSAAERTAGLATRLHAASGHPTRVRRPTPLAAFLASRRKQVSALVGEGRTVVWEEDGRPHVVEVDEQELEIVLFELVSNARDAMPGGGRLTIRVTETSLHAVRPDLWLSPPPGRSVVLELADTGTGIASADLSRIFEPFFTTRPLHEGRGLGLSVVHGILASYGGGLGVATTPGVGTRFSVYLPAATA